MNHDWKILKISSMFWIMPGKTWNCRWSACAIQQTWYLLQSASQISRGSQSLSIASQPENYSVKAPDRVRIGVVSDNLAACGGAVIWSNLTSHPIWRSRSHDFPTAYCLPTKNMCFANFISCVYPQTINPTHVFWALRKHTETRCQIDI